MIILGFEVRHTFPQVNVFGLDGNAFPMDGKMVNVVEHLDQKRLARLLKSKKSLGGKAQVVLGGETTVNNLADQALERDLGNQQTRRLLVLHYLAECDCPGTVPS